MGANTRGLGKSSSAVTLALSPRRGRCVVVDGDAHALAAKEQPKDAEFPVLESVDVGMRMGIEVEQWAGGDEGLAAALAAGEEKGNVGDLLGDGVDSAIDP